MRKKKKKPLHIGGNYRTRSAQPEAYGWCLYSRITGELFCSKGPSPVWVFRTRPEATQWRMKMFFAADYVVHRVQITPVQGTE